AALGYENDEKRDFVVNNQWNEPKSVKVSLSVNAFCRAILEMIPFSRQVLRKAKQQIKPGSCPTEINDIPYKDACTIECSHSDSRCKRKEKCCKIGCNIICVPPVFGNQ
uniref:WAP domain-containing protein n=1 Tax=Romanomermis culicivorax TaxID=13658 RepID=A0A915KW44_ROMCU